MTDPVKHPCPVCDVDMQEYDHFAKCLKAMRARVAALEVEVRELTEKMASKVLAEFNATLNTTKEPCRELP